MLKKISFLLTLPLFVLGFSCVAGATQIDMTGWTDITVWDGLISADHAWYNKYTEDNELEGEAITQDYDLEGLFYNASSNQLAIVGGYNFTDRGLAYLGGDIFMTADGVSYVLDISYDPLYGGALFTSYSLYSDTDPLDPISTDPTSLIPAAGPWRRDDGGVNLGSGNISFFDEVLGVSYEGDYDEYYNFWLGLGYTVPEAEAFATANSSDSHYALVVDLIGDLQDMDIFDASYTMECGNDLIRGAVPEPSTLLLFGAGLLGLGALGRKKFS